MHSTTKTLLAALLCAPLTALIPAQRADACSPQLSGYRIDRIPVLPALHPDQVVIPIHFSYARLNDFAPEDDILMNAIVKVTNAQSAEIAGSIQDLRITKNNNAPIPFARYHGVIVWRPDAPLPSGDYQLTAELVQRPGYESSEPKTITLTVREDAPKRQLTPPQISAALRAVPAGVDFTCCPLPQTSRGGYSDTCTGASIDPIQELQEPQEARISCGYEVGSACELCWPQRYVADPTLDVEWSLDDSNIPAGQLYYKVELSADGNTLVSPDGYIDHFGAGHVAAQYCATVRVTSMIDGQSVTAQRCIDRADMAPLPADPGAIKGADPRMQCDGHDSADMGSADMSEADMDHSSPDEGGCATPGGTSPGAPVAMLAAFGLVGWLRRRR
jgi:hypothetical protein